MLVEQLYFHAAKGDNKFKDDGTLYQYHEDDNNAMNLGGDVAKCKTVGGELFVLCKVELLVVETSLDDCL